MKKIYIILIALLFPLSAFAGDYESYSYSRKQIGYFEIQFSRNNNDMTIIGFADSDKQNLYYGTTDELGVTDNAVTFKNKNIFFTDSSLEAQGIMFLYDNISDCRITEKEEQIVITFLTTTDQSRLARFKKGNRITFSDDILVTEDDFVRGIILTITGNVQVDGEVNKDVVSLFGAIKLNPTSVVRGNLLSVTNKIKLDNGATLYGEIYDSDKKGRGKKHRLFRDESPFQLSERLEYNRVDGLSLTGSIKHFDRDSLLPSVELQLGYAFASDRGRFSLKAEQQILREPSLIAGGSIFKLLTTEDTELISRFENTAFALIVKEDYRDYYETTGGSLFLKYNPSYQFSIESGYTYFESDWLPSNRHLWSLFRGGSLFDMNFNDWEETIRESVISEVDSSVNGYLYSRINYKSDSTLNNILDVSHWSITGTFEWSQEGLSSDFDYRKYSIHFRRYQRISNGSVLLARLIHGNSDGYVPYYKRFYLGGLGTLHGYNHKEYVGTRYWLANSEYRLNFPKSEFGVALNWDIGQIANDEKINSEIEIKQSMGISLFFEDDFKISLAKRLDRSYDDKLKLYIRFKHIF